MALDSRQKRAAVVGVGRAWYRNAHPSSVNAAQRASVAQVYPIAVFQEPVTEIVAEEVFSGGFAYPLDRRLKPKKKEDKKAAVIIEKIAEKIAKTPEIETTKEIDLALRLRLECEHIKYKKLYLQWTKQQIKAKTARIKRKKRKQEDDMIIMLVLH